VLLEERCPGQELRVVVIGEEVVAAALRRPPEVEGTGDKTVAELIEGEKLNVRRTGISTPVGPCTM
jgi:D-alanine-D-alanine ligase-like ATP-grasp enzyme